MNKLASVFTNKHDRDLYPELVDIHESKESMLRRAPGFLNYMWFTDQPYWQNLRGLSSLFEWYHTNPVFYSIVMIKARAYSNVRIIIRNKYTGEDEDPVKTRKPFARKLYALLDKPNVLQSRWEFFMQRKIFEEVCGNSFTYGNFTLGLKPTIDNVQALWNVWPAYMQFQLGGKYFEATQIDEVVKEWKFEYGGYKKSWTPFEILHKNKPNTRIEDGLIFGRSPAHSLIRPLSNIDMAYESRNVIMRNRGMRLMITSNKGDASGAIPLNDDEKLVVEKEMKRYGTLENQSQFFFSTMPLTVTAIDQDVQKLGLFEEIATDAMTCCNAFGVPEILLKLYIKGATFENQEASVRRMYQETLIPEAEDDMIALGNFLGLADTDYVLIPDFSHVAALQESEKQKAERDKTEKDVAMSEFKAGLITLEEYRTRMGYGPMPVTEPKPPAADESTDDTAAE